jgi:hypothetical protein
MKEFKIYCSNCHIWKDLKEFKRKKTGKLTKQCMNCLNNRGTEARTVIKKPFRYWK